MVISRITLTKQIVTNLLNFKTACLRQYVAGIYRVTDVGHSVFLNQTDVQNIFLSV